MSKHDDEIGKLKTSQLVNYLAHPSALQERFPPPIANALGFGVTEATKTRWFEECAEFIQGVADELDRRVPARGAKT